MAHIRKETINLGFSTEIEVDFSESEDVFTFVIMMCIVCLTVMLVCEMRKCKQ